MLDVKQKIIEDLKKIVKGLTGQDVVPILQHPKDEGHGDYSSNIAMTLWANQESRIKNQELKSPFELAQKIVDSIIHNSQFMIHFDRVEAVKPGFINFWLSKESLINALSKPQSFEKTLNGKKIMVEFTDPNPFKEFHIGHLYSNTVGESISRLLEALGANVKRVNYQGDVGMHVAKAIYGIFYLCHADQAEPDSASLYLVDEILKSPPRRDPAEAGHVQDDTLNKRIKFLGQAYALGVKAYEEDEKAKREIEELNKKIYDKEPAITRLYEKGRRWSLEYFEEIYKRLGTRFDFYYFESEVGEEGLRLVKEFLKKGIFEESQGAVIFPGEKQGLHNRVFINSLGLPTYEAKELGLAPRKYSDFNYDQSIVVTGNEIIGYFKVLLAALGKIKPDLAAKTKHVSHGMVRLPIGKMSSRSGNVITGEWLLDEVKKLLKSKYNEMEKDTLEKVALGSVKYALLKSSIGHDIEFNFEESINIQGNSGSYLQYTFARTQSVLAKVKSQKSKVNPALAGQNSKLKFSFAGSLLASLHLTSLHPARSHPARLEAEETLLLRTLYRFPEVIEEAADLPAMQDGKALQAGKFAPNILCNYLFDLSQKFNLFYQKHKILESEEREFRLALTQSVGQVIKNGLYLLGIQAPERM